MKKLYLTLISAFVLFGCEPKEEKDIIQEGYRPIYISRESMEKISTLPPQPLRQPGKIYVKGDYLFVNELNKGIHIIDNRNPATPQKIAFLSIPGNVDIAAKGDVLYADNAVDLVSLDISDPTQVRLLKREKDVFPTQMYPAQTDVYFECVDASKGAVIGWEKATLTNPKCRR